MIKITLLTRILVPFADNQD